MGFGVQFSAHVGAKVFIKMLCDLLLLDRNPELSKLAGNELLH